MKIFSFWAKRYLLKNIRCLDITLIISLFLFDNFKPLTKKSLQNKIRILVTGHFLEAFFYVVDVIFKSGICVDRGLCMFIKPNRSQWEAPYSISQ